jgi:AcrR family transcriptional regulator
MSERYGEVDEGVKRSYVSPYRAEQAARTRARVLKAAIALFSEKGFVATTVDDIAATAGVSKPTVFTAVGSKRELVKQARDLALAGDDEPIPMPQRPWVDALRQEPDPARAVAIYAAAMRTVHERAARLELVIAAAADADPEVRDLAETALSQRHFGCQLVAGLLAAKVPLRGQKAVQALADRLFAVASPDLFHLLVHVRSWTPRQYERWLATTLQQQLAASG